MTRFADASALVKRYVREDHSDDVASWLGEGSVAISRLTEAEVSSALARRHRGGDLAAADYQRAISRLRADLFELDVVELAPAVVRRVHPLLRAHPLRAADALQLASALAIHDAVRDDVEFLCFDERLCAAAAAEGLVLAL